MERPLLMIENGHTFCQPTYRVSYSPDSDLQIMVIVQLVMMNAYPATTYKRVSTQVVIFPFDNEKQSLHPITKGQAQM